LSTSRHRLSPPLYEWRMTYVAFWWPLTHSELPTILNVLLNDCIQVLLHHLIIRFSTTNVKRCCFKRLRCKFLVRWSTTYPVLWLTSWRLLKQKFGYWCYGHYCLWGNCLET
jgi:hypothetical protein